MYSHISQEPHAETARTQRHSSTITWIIETSTKIVAVPLPTEDVFLLEFDVLHVVCCNVYGS